MAHFPRPSRDKKGQGEKKVRERSAMRGKVNNEYSLFQCLKHLWWPGILLTPVFMELRKKLKKAL